MVPSAFGSRIDSIKALSDPADRPSRGTVQGDPL